MIEPKYFTEVKDYPDISIGEILPFGQLWSYVSSGFCNAFINYGKPIACFVIDRYRPLNTQLSVPEVKFKGTKQELIYKVMFSEVYFKHTHLGVFRDDIVVVLELRKNSR